jgi:hypothetical protein
MSTAQGYKAESFGHSTEQMVVDNAVQALPAHGRLQLQLYGVADVHGSRGTPVLTSAAQGR